MTKDKENDYFVSMKKQFPHLGKIAWLKAEVSLETKEKDKSKFWKKNYYSNEIKLKYSQMN